MPETKQRMDSGQETQIGRRVERTILSAIKKHDLTREEAAKLLGDVNFLAMLERQTSEYMAKFLMGQHKS